MRSPRRSSRRCRRPSSAVEAPLAFGPSDRVHASRRRPSAPPQAPALPKVPHRQARHAARGIHPLLLQTSSRSSAAETATSWVSSGATTRAGSMLPTGTSRILSRRRPIPASIRPPVAVSAAMWASGSTEPSSTPTIVSSPWITPTDSAESRTPIPNVDANARAANPSSTDFRVSCSMPRPSPSEMLPRMVSGPTQNSSDAVSHPSMNRSRAACASSGLSPSDDLMRRATRVWIAPASPDSRSSIRSSEPTTLPTSSEPRTMRTGAPGPTALANDGSVTLTHDSPATRRVTRPRQSVTTDRVRSGRRWPIAMPRSAPMMTATTLMTVPRPGNAARTRVTLRAGQGRPGAASAAHSAPRLTRSSERFVGRPGTTESWPPADIFDLPLPRGRPRP